MLLLLTATFGGAPGGCTSLLGVDGDFELDPVSTGGGAPAASAATDGASTSAASGGDGGAGAAVGGGAGGAGGDADGGGATTGGGGGEEPAFELPPCDAPLQASPLGGLEHAFVLEGGGDALAPRVQVAGGGATVAWDRADAGPASYSEFSGGPFLREAGRDAQPVELVRDNVVMAFLDDDDLVLGAVIEQLDARATNTGITTLRDASQHAGDVVVLVRRGDAWSLDRAQAEGADVELSPLHAIACPVIGASVRDASLVAHAEEPTAVAACDDGDLVTTVGSVPLQPVLEPRSVAAARLGETGVVVAVRDERGVFLQRSTDGLAVDTVQLAAEAPEAEPGAGAVDRVTVARLGDGAVVAWTRRAGGVAAARCPPSGGCCDLALEEQLASSPTDELEAMQRAAPAVASSEAGSELTLAYVHQAAAGMPMRVVAMRLGIEPP